MQLPLYTAMVVASAQVGIQGQVIGTEHGCNTTLGGTLEHFHLEQAITGHRVTEAEVNAAVAVRNHVGSAVLVAVQRHLPIAVGLSWLEFTTGTQ